MATSPGQQPTPQRVFESMQSDRLVSIYVENATKPLLIQQSIIARASDYFRAAFANDGFEEAKKGVLHLPEDDVEAWELFIYWLLEAKVWEEATLVQLVRCWNLGDKYGVTQFQDDVMWVLFVKQNWESTSMLDTIKELFDAKPPGSRLRQFLGQQVALLMNQYDGCIWGDPKWLKLCEDPDTCKDLLAAMSTVRTDGSIRDWQNQTDDKDDPSWMRYMVGEGPNNNGNVMLGWSHWLNFGYRWWRL